MARPARVLAVAALAAVVVGAGPVRAEDGAALFAERCAACHQPGGEGAAGVAPPLRGSVWQRLGPAAPRYLALVLLNGMTGKLDVDGQEFNGGMPIQSAQSDEELAALATHVLKGFNGLDHTVVAPDIAALRGQVRRPAELKAIRAGSGS